MGFLKGSMSALRFAVEGTAPKLFGEDHIDRLASHAAGRQKVARADGTETGWTAGSSILDTAFDLAKNIVNDALIFDLRIDTDKLPADLLKAYYEVEIAALAKNNPSGRPSTKQKREAKETARSRLEDEAKDGRFRKRKCIPVMWDRISNEVLFGATSISHVDRLSSLFEQTFGMGLRCRTAGQQAEAIIDNPHGTAPSKFIPGVSPPDVAWIADESSSDHLGNEFLLWLWYHTDIVSDTFKLADASEVCVMMARTLTVDCPRGMMGVDTFKSAGPSKLPEALRAIRAGKLPRKAGVTLVRHNEQYEFGIGAELLTIQSAKLPKPDEDVTEPRARLEARVDAVRSLLEAFDLLYAAFLEKRLGKAWPHELSAMQRWLKREESIHDAATHEVADATICAVREMRGAFADAMPEGTEVTFSVNGGPETPPIKGRKRDAK